MRVLDAGVMLAGPLVGRVLGDLGAEVIKLEAPGGDSARGPGAERDDWEPNDFWRVLHRGTQCMAIDLKRPEGLDAVLSLLPEVDVFVENLRPGVMTRLGLGWDRVHDVNRSLVYCSVSGFGAEGTLSLMPATDGVIQAFSGWADPSADTDAELGMNPTLTIADFISGSMAAQAVLAALFSRSLDGEGRLVEVNMAEAMVYARALCDAPGLGSPSTFVAITRDGRRILIQTALHLAARLLDVIGDEPGFERVADDPRYRTKEGRAAHADDYLAVMRAAISRRSLDDWMRIFGAAGVPAAPVQTHEAAVAHPQIAQWGDATPGSSVERALPASPYRFNGVRRANRAQPVRVGENTAALLRRLAGYDEHQIAAVHESSPTSSAHG